MKKPFLICLLAVFFLVNLLLGFSIAHFLNRQCNHNWQDANCTSPKICTKCNAVSGDALGHTVSAWHVSSKSSCVEYGLQQGSCAICGETVSKTIALTEHTPGDWTVRTEPTQNQSGTRVKYCTICKKEVESESFTLSLEEIKSLYKMRCKIISYDDLARSPEKHKGEYVVFTGYVVQICSEASSALYYSTYRVTTNGKYDDDVLIYVDNYGSDSRILEDDRITFYGIYDGLYTYTTVMGASRTIPSIKVGYIE